MVRHSLAVILVSLLVGIFGSTTLVVSTSFFASEASAKSPEKAKRPKFAKKKISIGDKTITVEVADNDEKRAYGLMYVEKMAKNEGMLFIFDNEDTLSFWMKNTLIPLSIAYIDKNKVVTEILDMQPAVMGAARPKSYPSRKKVMYALEMNIGWYAENKIWPGATLKFADN